MKIFKYPLKVTDVQTLEIHKNFIPLKIELQNGIPCMWCKINEEEPKIIVQFETIGTGHYFNGNNLCYIDSYQINNGTFVYHVFYNNFDYQYSELLK